METVIFTLLVIGILVFVLPIVALSIASGASRNVEQLRERVERLTTGLASYTGLTPAMLKLEQQLKAIESRLDRLESGAPPAADTQAEPSEMASGEPSQALEPRQDSKPEEVAPAITPVRQGSEVVPETPPAPPSWAGNQAAKTTGEAAEVVKPANTQTAAKAPNKPEPILAHAKAVGQGESKAEPGSLEMKLGTYWFVRIGVVLLLTGAGILAYYKKQFFFDLSPLTKVCGLYLLSALMGGVGLWLQRTREKFKNYGQVLLAGGLAGVYFTTYAAHIFPPVQIIPNPTVALLLLFAWGALIVWAADRLKSETLALFAIGASYYATFVPLIHSGSVSHWVILASNLILAVAAVAFMLRNRWLKMPVLSMSAAYAGFFFWRLRVLESPSLAIVLLFACSLWVVYTAAVFLSQHEAFDDRKRAAFLTANNATLFGLLTWDVLRDHNEQFWILPMALGVTLLGCALGAVKVLQNQPLSRLSYLTQGLVLVTLGLMTTQLSESIKGPMLAAESVVLLFMAIRRENKILEFGACIAAAIAATYGFVDIGLESDAYLLSCLFVGAFLLFNAWLCHRRLEADDRRLLRARTSYFTSAGLVVGTAALILSCLRNESDWLPAILLGTTALFSASVYLLRLREFVLLGQAAAAIGLVWSLQAANLSPDFTWPLFCAAVVTLGLAHWWRWQRDALISCHAESDKVRPIALIAEAVFSAGVILQLLVWIHARIGFGDEWLVLGSLLAAGTTIYGLLTRAPFIASLAQTFLVLACAVMVDLCLGGDGGDAWRALVPIATMVLTNLALPVVAARFGQAPEILKLSFAKIQTGYRIGAGTLGLLWIYRFVPEPNQVLATAALGALFLLVHPWRPAKEWHWLSAAYIVASAFYLIGEFGNREANWQSLAAVIGLLGVQQLARRNERIEVPEEAQKALILGGGIALFLWTTLKVAALMPTVERDGLRSIIWAVLAVLYFSLGLKLRERWYRLMGLGTLGIALLSLVPIIWQMSTELKIASFFVLGLVFVGLGFVYNHHKEQIKKLL